MTGAVPNETSVSEEVIRYPERRKELIGVLNEVAQYHLVDDPTASVFPMAVAVSNSLEGSPLWGMIVGPASGGKTEALGLIRDVVAEDVDDFTVPALLSWSRPSGKSIKVKPVGILTA